jgi:hypothetical protein
VFWPDEVHPEGSWTENIHLDFLHIYAELRHGMQLLDQSDIASAFTYWSDSCFFHWGHHASSAVWGIEDYGLGKHAGEPAASPNGGPATLLGNSGVTEGPPSVS